jgi:hypothetical protein
MQSWLDRCSLAKASSITPTLLSVASGIEVDEGRWGRSEGQIGSMKVRCKSVWLLHFAAAPPIRLVLAT